MRKHLKPQATNGKIESVKVGPIWTFVTIKLATDRLALAGARKAFKKKLSSGQAARRLKML